MVNILKHGKYAYIEIGKGKYIKVRVIKNREENSPDRYIIADNLVRKFKPRNAIVLKLDNLPVEVKDKITRTFL